VRDKNKKIVTLTKEKEEIESKMLQEVKDSELSDLQKEHQALIKEYEGIIKEKIDIFTLMIKNLNDLSDGNKNIVANEDKMS